MNSRIRSLTLSIAVFYATALATSLFLERGLPSIEILITIPVFGFFLLWACRHPRKAPDSLESTHSLVLAPFLAAQELDEAKKIL